MSARPVAAGIAAPFQAFASTAAAAVGQEQRQVEALRRCRASRARAFRFIHTEWPKLHGEAVSFWMLWYARRDLRQAARDCETLDALRVQMGLPPIYVAEAVAFDSRGALDSLYYRAWKEVCGHARGHSPFGAAVQREDIETARDKLLLDDLRETLRDGLSADEALSAHREPCAARIQAGRTDFVIALGKLLDEARRCPQKYTRSVTDWVERAWLPLRLWGCEPDGEEAWSRLKEAMTVLPIPEIAFHQFHTAWRNLRSRMRGVR